MNRIHKDFWIGSNYWPAHAGIRMWSNWQPDTIFKDLKKMVDLGFTVNRSFLFMPDFMPTSNHVESVMIERFIEFLSLCEKANIGTLPTLFVGHMSGEDWDVSWRGNSNFYTNPKLRLIQKKYVETVVNAAKEASAVQGWILSNEIYNYEPDGSPDEIAAWVADMSEIIKENDPKRPVSTGEGARGPETNRHLPNFQTRKFIPYIDFVGLHYYPRPQNPWHQTFTTAYRINISQFWGKPVVIEEFGHSTTMGSEQNQAHYYRNVLYSALINGAQGILNWCFTDFDLHKERPYIHHPFELRFGIYKTNGELRPAGEVMKQYAELACELTSHKWTQINFPEIVLLVPSNYYYHYPHDYDSKFESWYPLYLDVFSNLKRINLSPRLLLEPAVELENNGKLTHNLNLDPQQHPVIILPRLKRITAEFWEKLKQYVKEGGTLYASFAQDHWIPDWEEFFGITSDLKFGLPSNRNWNELHIIPTKKWGVFDPKIPNSILLQHNHINHSYCPILETTGDVLLKDQENHPILVHSTNGKGHVYYNLYPMEMISLEKNTGVSDNVLQMLFKSLWSIHGKKANINTEGQDLEFGIWRNRENNWLKLVVVNHSWKKRSGRLSFLHPIESIKQTSFIKSKTKNEIEFDIPLKDILTLDIHLQESSKDSKVEDPVIHHIMNMMEK